MDTETLQEEIGNTLENTGYRDDRFGEYHPSKVTGCPLKGLLDKMADIETELNCWLFQGSAVHHYLQEAESSEGFDGIITEGLHNAGYHVLDTDYEVHTKTNIDSDVTLTGTCDIICSNDDGRTIFDIKYSSVTPATHEGRLFKYLSQVNAYSHMFGADHHGLILINSRAGMGNSPPHSIPEGITIVGGEPDEENWNITKRKAVTIHQALEEAGYDSGERWSVDMLESANLDFWKNVLEVVSKEYCPSYEEECKYCDHKEYCPVKQGKLDGGLDSFRGGT